MRMEELEVCALFVTFLLVLQLAAIALNRGTTADIVRLSLGISVFVVGILILGKHVSEEFTLLAIPLCVLVLIVITPKDRSGPTDERQKPQT